MKPAIKCCGLLALPRTKFSGSKTYTVLTCTLLFGEIKQNCVTEHTFVKNHIAFVYVCVFFSLAHVSLQRTVLPTVLVGLFVFAFCFAGEFGFFEWLQSKLVFACMLFSAAVLPEWESHLYSIHIQVRIEFVGLCLDFLYGSWMARLFGVLVFVGGSHWLLALLNKWSIWDTNRPAFDTHMDSSVHHVLFKIISI